MNKSLNRLSVSLDKLVYEISVYADRYKEALERFNNDPSQDNARNLNRALFWVKFMVENELFDSSDSWSNKVLTATHNAATELNFKEEE